MAGGKKSNKEAKKKNPFPTEKYLHVSQNIKNLLLIVVPPFEVVSQRTILKRMCAALNVKKKFIENSVNATIIWGLSHGYIKLVSEGYVRCNNEHFPVAFSATYTSKTALNQHAPMKRRLIRLPRIIAQPHQYRRLRRRCRKVYNNRRRGKRVRRRKKY